MTCWQRRIGSISGSAGAEPNGNSAKANRGEYDGAFISTQLTGGSEVNNTAAVNADLAGPEVDNLTVPIWFRRGRTIPRAMAADRILMLTRRHPRPLARPPVRPLARPGWLDRLSRPF